MFHKLDYGVMTECDSVIQCETDLPFHARTPTALRNYQATFVERTLLAEAYLKCLAKGQELVTGVAPAWANTFHTHRKLRMSVLQYFPGMPGVETTVRHTDTSWVTILEQDEVCGLCVHRLADRAVTVNVPPRQGSLVVNSGNALEDESGEFFLAVQHAVIRPVGSDAERTRFSLPFFYGKK